MKDIQHKQRTQIRRRVAHDLPQRTKSADKPAQAATTGGIAVRTDLKAGSPLLAAGLLGNGATAGGGAIPS